MSHCSPLLRRPYGRLRTLCLALSLGLSSRCAHTQTPPPQTAQTLQAPLLTQEVLSKPSFTQEAPLPESTPPAEALPQNIQSEVQRWREAAALALESAAPSELSRVARLIENPQSERSVYVALDEARQKAPLSALLDVLLLTAARQQKALGEIKRAQILLNELMQARPIGEQTAAAQALQAQLNEIMRLEPKTIGVVLPLTGPKAPFGKSALSAIKIAFEQSGKGYQLRVQDTQGDPENARRALKELVEKEHVIAVIGPLFSEESVAAAQRAESYGVPLIALSRKEGLTQMGPAVFRLCLTPEQQVKALLKAAFEVFGYRHFALMYPNMETGIEYANLFWEEVTRLGGDVKAVESYARDQSVLHAPAQKLLGRFHPRGEAAGLSEEMIAIKDAPGLRYPKPVKRSPQIDFEAIFIADNAKQASALASFLAYENLNLAIESQDKRLERRKGKAVRLLGVNGFNSAQLLERGGKLIEGALFVDGFFAQDSRTVVQNFVKAFHLITGHDPILPDAQAYDAASLLLDTLTRRPPSTRAQLMTQLSQIQRFEGATGFITFDAQREAVRAVYLLTVKEGVITLLDSAEKAPPSKEERSIP